LKFLDQQAHCYNHIFPKQQTDNLIHLTFIPYYETIMGMKKTKWKDFQIAWTKVSLILNLGHGMKKSKAKNDVWKCECKIFLLQKHDKNKTRS
jgi:hypothetical protein